MEPPHVAGGSVFYQCLTRNYQKEGEDITMNRRRFMFLTLALVAVNSFFWLAQGGFALPMAIINQFFGNRMVRAEVLVQAADGSIQDWRIDRGVITAVSATSITLKEKDATSVTIPVDPNARIQGSKYTSLLQLKRRLRVVVYHQANLPAETVQVEGVGG
jgi:hypothetical protein